MSLSVHSPIILTADKPRVKDHIEKVSVHEVEDVSSVCPLKSSTKRMRNGEKGYYRNEELGGPIHTEREMRVVVIGAGVSGLCFAYKLQRSFENFSLQLYEKNPEISGTWYENRYPGYVYKYLDLRLSWLTRTDAHAMYLHTTTSFRGSRIPPGRQSTLAAPRSRTTTNRSPRSTNSIASSVWTARFPTPFGTRTVVVGTSQSRTLKRERLSTTRATSSSTVQGFSTTGNGLVSRG